LGAPSSARSPPWGAAVPRTGSERPARTERSDVREADQRLATAEAAIVECSSPEVRTVGTRTTPASMAR
ncbi:MAG: hypothetical protein ACRD0K_26745, partial [Egibacteraceae bacterium]